MDIYTGISLTSPRSVLRRLGYTKPSYFSAARGAFNLWAKRRGDSHPFFLVILRACTTSGGQVVVYAIAVIRSLTNSLIIWAGVLWSAAALVFR